MLPGNVGFYQTNWGGRPVRGSQGEGTVGQVQWPDFRIGLDSVYFGRQGERFITTNRYSENWEWAGLVEGLTESTVNSLDSFKSGQDLIDHINREYGDIVRKTSPSDFPGRFNVADQWGVERTEPARISVSLFPGIQSRIEADFAIHAVNQGSRKDRPFPESEEGRRFQPGRFLMDLLQGAVFGKNKVRNYTVDIDGKPVVIFKILKTMQFRFHLFQFSLAKPNAVIKKHISDLTEAALNMRDLPKNGETLKQAVNTVARLHWLISLSMPYKRGSAGVADILSKVIFDSLGIETGNWKKQISPDLEAFATPKVEDYINDYPSFFTSPPRFKAAAVSKGGCPE